MPNQLDGWMLKMIDYRLAAEKKWLADLVLRNKGLFSSV